MKKINIIILFLFVFFDSCGSLENKNKMEADKYVNITLEQMVEELGVPDYLTKQFVDDKYLPTPIEPYYGAFFSTEELQKGVTITVARWIEKNNTHIIIWLKNTGEKWVVFSSLKYQKKANVIIG